MNQLKSYAESSPTSASCRSDSARDTPLSPLTQRVSTRGVVVRELFFSRDVNDLCADQRSQVRGYEDCLPHGSSFSSTAAFSPQ